MSIEAILQTERTSCSVPVVKLSEFLYTPDFYHSMRNFLQSAPVFEYSPNIYNESRLELIKDSYKTMPSIYNYNQGKDVHPHIRSIYGALVNPHQMPGSIHFAMFQKYIDLMGTEQHRKLYLQKCKTMEIVGCYAQTQIGHGSDIRGLQTTATFDQQSQQWILNSPSLTAAKYWPGDLSILATHAMVFAQAISGGKTYGVYPFLTQIKDSDHNWLPGIEGGDIGPKIGFHAKENGYMLLHNVRVPKDNLLSKQVKVSNTGVIQVIGDARLGYGTMMHIRELISCALPKSYAQAIIIAARYSLFRKQFRNQHKQEIPIIQYQIQQDKVLSRVAEYYAITLAGTRIRLVSQQNSSNILKTDFSLLQQTHSNLSFSKGLFSEIVHEGIQICRRSLGGHGTSYYSGLPQLLNEYAPNNTHEGENTVMYLQTSRYILKSYRNYILKGKPLTDSVQYISKFAEITDLKFLGKTTWSISDLRNLLLKSIEYIITVITTRLSNKQSAQTEADIINYKVGIRLQQLAQLHGVHYTVDSFIRAIDNEQNNEIKSIVTDLCHLYAINQVHRLAQPIVEAGFVCPIKFAELQVEKEHILKRIRPLTVTLLDSFGIPEKYLRSELVSGNPYQKFLDRARECQLNQKVTNSQILVGNIKDVLAARPSL